ncbi:MAG: acid phosphatase [Pseudonocardia sp.]|uniref:acid phosphatase n=1 Tax=unclassified Pseudonocardia TaxID=2619320 RepID=UPI00086BA0B5|nr:MULTISPECIES: acid phosphatase [unclassified Pseudonocardia]MBN9108457.1 acid phosphatase [Pseudonocardia sp.]ODU23653.1 MAG: acid phosphatase [Pseudonocardia sp. SCN 72-51]ODV07883.1 MAG: acid phosphatase [Pseudonocardia sp. SCN 73-27]
MTPSTGRIYLLRHGETEWSQSGRHTGRTDIELTDRGRERAVATGALLPRLRGTTDPPALVVASPRVRARVTADLAGLHVDRIDDRLAEWDYGDYEGVTTPEIRETVPGWTVWTHPTPGGETAEQVTARADAMIGEAEKHLEQGDVVLVGHGQFSRVLMARWIGLAAAGGQHIAMDPAAWAVLGFEREAHQLAATNVTPALAG